MTDTHKLAARIRALSDSMGVAPATLSRKLLGNGNRLAELEAGGTVTLTTFSRVTAALDEMEGRKKRQPAKAKAA